VVRGGEKHRIVIHQSKRRKMSPRSARDATTVGRKPNTHREGRHGIQRVAINLGRDECQYEVGHAVKSRERVTPRVAACIKNVPRNLRTDVERP